MKRNKGRYRGPGYVWAISEWYKKTGRDEWHERRVYFLEGYLR